jgi:hypothetical protein
LRESLTRVLILCALVGISILLINRALPGQDCEDFGWVWFHCNSVCFPHGGCAFITPWSSWWQEGYFCIAWELTCNDFTDFFPVVHCVLC